MNFLKLITAWILLVAACFSCSSGSDIHIADIYCDGMPDPSGVSINSARFSWVMESQARNQAQSAYRIGISSSAKKLGQNSFDIYSSGFIKSPQSVLVPVSDMHLDSGEKYFWKVRIKDSEGKQSAWSEAGEFVTLLNDPEDWQSAQWIGYEDLEDSLRLVPGIHGSGNSLGPFALQRPVTPLLRKEFFVEKTMEEALLFITGLGHYEFYLNGKKPGKDFLQPGWTQYDETVYYNTYDLTKSIVHGENVLGVILGNGFYNINREGYRKLVIAYGMPKMLCRLKLKYTDGTEQIMVSDPSWKTHSSPIEYNSIFAGEQYNATLEQDGWDLSGYDDSNWQDAILVTPPNGKLMPQTIYPLQVDQSFEPVRITHNSHGNYLYDFGQNLSGIIELKVKGKRGQKVVLKPAELITTDSTANQNASGRPYEWSYTLKGDGEEIWRPRFSYYGFRYVEVIGGEPEGLSSGNLPIVLNMRSLHTRNSAPVTGEFSCSNELFNQTFRLIKWAIQSNFASVISDCPHREKLGWLEQTHLMGEGIHFNFDIYQLYLKQIRDMMDAQTPEGLVPDIAPEYVQFAGGFRDSPEWGSAAVLLPWLVNKWYGDMEIMREAYPMMKKYVYYLQSASVENIVSHGLGDWYDLGPGFPGTAQLTPRALTATAFYYYDAFLLSEMASLLDYHKDAELLGALASRIKKDFNREFFDPVTKSYSTASQTALSIPLCMGLVDEDEKSYVFESLLRTIERDSFALTAGDVGFHFLVHALSVNGASETLYRMNNREDVPGYGFQLKKGATALTESWAALEEVSNNHLMLGHLMEWFYNGLGGISQAESSAGYEKLIIKPQMPNDVDWASARFNTVRGEVYSSWERHDGNIIMDIIIPVNSLAHISFPVKDPSLITESGSLIEDLEGGKISEGESGEVVLEIGSGDYHFVVQGINILVVTGGHDYDRQNFLEMFESFDGIEFDEAILPEANQIYASDSIDKYDVLVYFDLFQEISELQKKAFLEMLERGKGIVFLHHSLASYQDWDEFTQIRGGKYDLDSSTYAHGQDVLVKISDPKHHITRGLENFLIHDETYNLYEVLPGVYPLIQTDHSESESIIGWTNMYGNSRIVYLQPGHDNNAFSNPNYRKLVQRSIVWAGGRGPGR